MNQNIIFGIIFAIFFIASGVFADDLQNDDSAKSKSDFNHTTLDSAKFKSPPPTQISK